MKTIEFEFNKQIYHLSFNGAALFDCYDRFGTKGDITDYIIKPTRTCFNNTCWIIAELSEQGTAVRRYMGLTAPKPLTEIECRMLMKPVDANEAKKKIIEAIAYGFSRDEKENEKEIDLGLAELNQKKKAKSHEHNIFAWLYKILTCQSKKDC